MINNSRHSKAIDKVVFEKYFRDHFIELAYFAQKFTGDMDSSKDIVHQVFINLWEKKDEIDTSTPLKAYLFTSVRNRCMNYIRDRKKFSSNEIPDEAELTESTDPLESKETEIRIQQVINDLPEKCREIFLLNRIDGLRYREVANELGISIKTVEAQMTKALKILRERLSEYLILFITWVIYFIKHL